MLHRHGHARLTPEHLWENVVEGARRFIEDPMATVLVTQINSRKVFITGQVGQPGAYPLTGPTRVLQLIAMAGGLQAVCDLRYRNALKANCHQLSR